LPIVLPPATVDALANDAQAGKPFSVDLENQTINGSVGFDVSPRRKKMLLEGLDEIGLTLALEPKIAAFEVADRVRRPWIYS
jgi:3-isopropylmalate dehydratase small subunit